MAITVDTTLSTTSTNPVENKAITNALNTKADSSSLPHGVPSGGTTGQVLVKSSNTDYAVEWQTVTTPSGTKNISISSNGTTTEDVTNYATASITTNVPASAVDSGTKNISITQNGTTTENVVGYASASITANVPNTYSAGDEGKVVSSGALVAQTSDTVTANDTYDTTLISSLTVNVSGGGGVDINNIADGTLSGVIHITTATDIVSNAFYNFKYVTQVILDNAVTITTGSFRNMTSLLTFSGNKITTTSGSDQIRGCTLLQTISMGSLSILQGTDDMRDNPALTTVDLGVVSVINARTFYGGTSLSVLILRRTSITSLGNVTAFDGTPFASGGAGGTIYIPKTLYDALGTGTNDYKAASNWSTIDGYGTITWAKIEGSYYETHYADGTTIPT